MGTDHSDKGAERPLKFTIVAKITPKMCFVPSKRWASMFQLGDLAPSSPHYYDIVLLNRMLFLFYLHLFVSCCV